ncbi:MAG: polyphosphate polymerase domain-containing protein [Eubacterium sp.]|nr:polyphosphate polymerase domain-containing protein [Eubacterium sp.]
MSVYIENFKRTEIKYLLTSNQFDSLFSFLQGFAKVDSYGKTRINNIYFDTPDYKLIRTSLEKPIYKEKLRLRTYGETTDDTNSFIEIKKKYDGIVYKRRVSGRYKDAFDYLVRAGKPLDASQISREIAGFIDMYEDLRPAMRISYDRIAMAGIYDPDFRVTFDTKIEWDTESLDLRYKSIGIPILKEGEYMMEIKVKDSMSYELTEKLSELGIFPASFSKYGRGYEAMLRSRLHVGTLEERSVTSKKGVRAYA